MLPPGKPTCALALKRYTNVLGDDEYLMGVNCVIE